MNEKITVVLPENSKHALMPVPLKCERMLGGKKVLTYVNGSGRLINMPIEEYVEAVTDRKDLKKLGIRTIKFQSSILNLTHGMDASDIRTSNIGHTFERESNPGEFEFFTIYPDAILDGVQKGKPNFIVTTVSKMKNKRVESRKTRQEIINYVDSLNENQLRDILIWFGKNRGERSKDEMVNILVDGETILKTSGEKQEMPAILFDGDNLADFRKTFMDKLNPNYELVLNINKAKLYKIITIEGAGDGWYLNGSFIAIDDRELQAYFTTNKNIYDSIVTKIDRIEEGDKAIVKENLIPQSADTEDITLKSKLTLELTKLVDSGLVTLPEDTFIPNMELAELKEYCAIGKEARKLTIIASQKAGESVIQYKGRLSKKVGELIEQGGITLSEGTKRNTLKVVELENLLIAYEKKLTTPA